MKTLRTLVLVAFAVAALVVPPAAASAMDGISVLPPRPAELGAEEYPTELTGERYDLGPPLVGETRPIDVNGVTVNCDVAELYGGELTHTETSFELDAEFSGCVAKKGAGETAATVNMNSCRYVYASLDLFDGNEFEAPMAIACDEGDTVEAKFWGCTVKVPAQELGAPIDLINGHEPGEEVIYGEMVGSGLQYTSKGLGCALIGVSKKGGEEAHEDGGIHLHVTLRGDVAIIPPKSYELGAAEYPVTLTGERYDLGPPLVGEVNPIEVKGTTVTCDTAEFDGGELTESVTAFDLDADYSECIASKNGSAAVVSMNSCHYSYPEITLFGGNEFQTPMAIACDGGDVIEVTFSGCTVKVPAQELGAPIDLINGHEPGEEVIYGEMVGSGLQYTSKGLACALLGVSKKGGEEAHEDGGIHLHMTLRGDVAG